MPIVQLHHAGAVAKQAPDSKIGPVADPENGVRAATAQDVDRVVELYVQAALRAEAAGFAGVEIHGANGYFFTQFLAPGINSRRDAFGGSLARRAKPLRRATQAVRAAVSDDFIVGVRISPVDAWTQRGLLLDDGLQVGQWLAEDGADFIHLSLSDALGAPRHEETDRIVVTAFREALPKDVAIVAAGGVWTPADAQAVLDAGADVVALGKAAIGNPDWPQLAADSDWQPSRPPWSREHLAEASVSPRFLEYLAGFRNLVG